MTTHNTTNEARRLYAELLRHSEVISLCAMFGLTEYSARALMEGDNPIIKGRAMGPPTRKVNGQVKQNSPRKYYKREDVITACQSQ